MGEHAEYEFTDSQNQIISQLASKMGWVAMFGLVVGVMIAVLGLFSLGGDGQGLVFLVQSVFVITIALWTRRAALGFRQVVETTGSDISNVMSALGELKKLYTLHYWLIIVGILVMGVALSAAGLFWMSSQ